MDASSEIGASDQTAAPTHYYWLDWLRFAAALMVVLNHARVQTWVKLSDLPPADQTLFFKLFLTVSRLGAQAVIVFLC